jgi:hypothetical protein
MALVPLGEYSLPRSNLSSENLPDAIPPVPHNLRRTIVVDRRGAVRSRAPRTIRANRCSAVNQKECPRCVR